MLVPRKIQNFIQYSEWEFFWEWYDPRLSFQKGYYDGWIYFLCLGPFWVQVRY